MSLYSAFVKKISVPIIAMRNGSPKLMNYVKQLEESQYWSRKRLLDYQFERIKALLIHAYKHTDFYRRTFDHIDFNPYEFSHLSELKKIPPLTKRQIRDNFESLISNNYPKDKLYSSETGGTTGISMKFYCDNSCISPRQAALFRFEKWTGWDFGERMGLVWPAQQDYVGHWTKKAKIKNELFGRQIVFPAAIIDETAIANYVKMLIAKNPTMIRAFSSPLYEIAKYIKNRDIDNINLKGVITTGEPLYYHQRKLISEAFNCNVFDSYRSREVGPLAQECELHNGMHINAESLYIETISPEDSHLFEEGIGVIIVTDLLNYGMPLIRYKIDDMGILSDEICPCGRGLPLLKKLVGRTSDILYTPEKKLVTAGSLVLYIVDEAPGLLGQVQIIQDRIDHLIIKMTSNPPPTLEIKEYQRKVIRRLFGEKMKVSFETVAKIPTETSGKYLFTKCLLSEKDLS